MKGLWVLIVLALGVLLGLGIALRERFSARLGAWSVRLVALLTGLMGLVNVLSAVLPALHARMVLLDRYSPLEVRHGSRMTAALAGFALLMLAGSLWRRKRIAWLLTVIILAISAVSHLVKGLDYEEALLAGALLAWLLWLRPHFFARSDPPSIQQGFQALVAALLFTLLYGTTGFYFLERHFKEQFGLIAAIRQTVVMFTQFYDPGLVPITGFGRYFAGSIYVVGAATLAYASFMLIRPVLLRRPSTLEERKHAQTIVEAYGRSPLARLTLMEDKFYYFSPGGSGVAFAHEGRVALALGDPIGPPEDALACIRAFRLHCAENDWLPAFYQVRPDYLAHYRAEEYDLLGIGSEGIVDLTTFSLSGSENKNVRNAYNRIVRLGFTANPVLPPISHELLAELREVSDEWLVTMHGTEKRFSLGWYDEAYLSSVPLMVIRNPEGQVESFASLLPEYQRSEMSIDLMRHRQRVENGLMEFLFVSLFQWTRQQGCSSFSLGLSALSGMGQKPGDPAIERALNYIFTHVSRFYNFKGLHSFKEKFHPRWEPRYLAYPGAASLLAVAVALIRADSGDDWIESYLKK